MTNDALNQSRDEADQTYEWKLQKEAEFWGTMAKERRKGGIPMTMDFSRATRYRVRRSVLGWGDYFQDPALEALTPFGRARIKFVNTVRNEPGKRALDLCCGAGWLALELARSGKHVDAVDLSLEEITVAKEYQATLEEEIPGRINWIVSDLNTYVVDEGAYDQVTSWDGLHHVQKIDALCSAAARSLKPHGRFTLSERTWGGEKPSKRARIGRYLEEHLWTIVPTPSPMTYRRKFKQLFETWKTVFRAKVLRKKNLSVRSQTRVEGFCSPFEDTSGPEVLAAVRRYFDIEKIESYGGFTEEILRSIYLPRVLRIPTVLVLGWLDYLVVRAGLLEGKITMVYARKRA